MLVRSLISLSLLMTVSVADEIDLSDGNVVAPPVNIISSDYSETSIVEEIPVESNNGDVGHTPHKVKVHKSYHRKHKGLPQVVQPSTNNKIEEITKEQGKSDDKPKKRLNDSDLLAKFQESTAYHWWLEISLKN